MDKINDAENYADTVMEGLYEVVYEEELTEEQYDMLIEILAIRLEEPISYEDVLDQF